MKFIFNLFLRQHFHDKSLHLLVLIFSQSLLVVRSVRVFFVVEEAELRIGRVVFQDECDELLCLLPLGCHFVGEFVDDCLLLWRGHYNLDFHNY